MSEKSGFWNNAIVTGIVVGLSVPALLGVAHYAGVTVASAVLWLTAVGKFWAADVTLNRWVFWLSVLLTVLFGLFIALQIYYNTSKPAGAPVSATDKPTTFAGYKTDVFFGFRWRWTVYLGGSVDKVSMYCPNCDWELSSSNFERGHHYGVFVCRCEHCNYAHGVDVASSFELSQKVVKAAERKIRTGEWEKPEKTMKYAKSPVRSQR
ncbi:MAG TPA: hypothetical protein VGL08_01070 [Paraburkholderia sp.]